MTQRSIYDYTSIARPVDPAWPSNRAVLIIVPAVALASALAARLGIGAVESVGGAAVGAALVAFGAWALGRELAPDDNVAAFIGMAIAVGLQFAAGTASVLPLFVCLFQVRIVNRTTGKAATVPDTIIVAALTLWAAFRLGQPFLALTGGIAFALDGRLRPAAPRQYVAAAVCIGVPASLALYGGIPPLRLEPLPVAESLLAFVVLLGFTAVALTTGPVRSTGDATGETLSTARVRAGMLVALLVALQSSVSVHWRGVSADPWILASFAGVVLGRLRTVLVRA